MESPKRQNQKSRDNFSIKSDNDQTYLAYTAEFWTSHNKKNTNKYIKISTKDID